MSQAEELKKMADALEKKATSISFIQKPGYRGGGTRATIADAPADLVKASKRLLAAYELPDIDDYKSPGAKELEAADAAFADALINLFEREYENIPDLPEWVDSKDTLIESIENLDPEKVEGNIVYIRSKVEYR